MQTLILIALWFHHVFKSRCKAVTCSALALSAKARAIKRLLWPLTFLLHPCSSIKLTTGHASHSFALKTTAQSRYSELLHSIPPANQKQPWQMVAASEGCWTGTGRFCPDSHTHLSDFLQALQNNRERHLQNRSQDLNSRMFARIYAQTIGLFIFLLSICWS